MLVVLNEAAGKCLDQIFLKTHRCCCCTDKISGMNGSKTLYVWITICLLFTSMKSLTQLRDFA